MSMFKQNKTKSMSTTVTDVLPGVLWLLKGNGLYDCMIIYNCLRCDCKQHRDVVMGFPLDTDTTVYTIFSQVFFKTPVKTKYV